MRALKSPSKQKKSKLKPHTQEQPQRSTHYHREDFTPVERALFVRFVWGRSRLPLRASQFRHRFKLQAFHRPRPPQPQQAREDEDGDGDDQYLPVAHTCFFALDLPSYSSRAVCADRLRYAIHHCSSIDLDNTALGLRGASLGWDG